MSKKIPQILEAIDGSIRFNPNISPEHFNYWQDSWRRLKTNRMAMIGFYALVVLVFMAIVGPFLTPYTYYETHLHLKNSSPSAQFWFGTDELGRDLFTRVWWGARISLLRGDRCLSDRPSHRRLLWIASRFFWWQDRRTR